MARASRIGWTGAVLVVLLLTVRWLLSIGKSDSDAWSVALPIAIALTSVGLLIAGLGRFALGSMMRLVRSVRARVPEAQVVGASITAETLTSLRADMQAGRSADRYGAIAFTAGECSWWVGGANPRMIARLTAAGSNVLYRIVAVDFRGHRLETLEVAGNGPTGPLSVPVWLLSRNRGGFVPKRMQGDELVAFVRLLNGELESSRP